MIGQEDILTALTTPSLGNLPHSILLVGERGSGKHTLAKEVAGHYGLSLEDISDKLTYDTLAKIQLSSIPKIYLVYLSGVAEREQNVILKFVEEPSDNAYVILLADSKTGVLDTVINRCVQYSMRPYARELLRKFLPEGCDESALDCCSTPGQVMSAAGRMGEMRALADAMVNKIGVARFDNALSIARKFNYRDIYDKFDPEAFLRVFLKASSEAALRGDGKALRLYVMADGCLSAMQDQRLSKEALMESMLIDMWRYARNGLQGA